MMNGYFLRLFHTSSRLLGNPGGCKPPPPQQKTLLLLPFFIPTQDPEEGTDMEHDTALSMTCYVFQI